MSNIGFGELIKKAFNYYDLQCNKYNKYINDVKFDYNNANKELLGIYDVNNKIWIWGWVIPRSEGASDITISGELISYGLNIDYNNGSQDHYFIKSLLLNSRLLIDDIIQLEINVALCSYILKDRIQFIYIVNAFVDKNNTNRITYYYLIKNI
jgi:hypothetical protein